MKEKTITIPVKEYKRLKECEKLSTDVLQQLKKAVEDVKWGRIKRVA